MRTVPVRGVEHRIARRRGQVLDPFREPPFIAEGNPRISEPHPSRGAADPTPPASGLDGILAPVSAGRISSRLRALSGIVGPVAFTLAWAVSGRRQDAYSVRHEHISGLAAPDATDPQIMTAGFLALGLGAIVLAWELQDRLGGAPRAGMGPGLMAGAGASALLAGLLRRDRMANAAPDEIEPYRQSLVNDGHDYASIVGQTCTFLSLIALANRFRGDPAWSRLRWPALACAGLSGALGLYFAVETARPRNGTVQRIAITAPLAGMVALAVRLLRASASRG